MQRRVQNNGPFALSADYHRGLAPLNEARKSARVLFESASPLIETQIGAVSAGKGMVHHSRRGNLGTVP